MYPFLMSETLFTPFGLQMDKLEEEKREKKVKRWRILKITLLSKFQKCSFWLDLDSVLSKLSNGTKNIR